MKISHQFQPTIPKTVGKIFFLLTINKNVTTELILKNNLQMLIVTFTHILALPFQASKIEASPEIDVVYSSSLSDLLATLLSVPIQSIVNEDKSTSSQNHKPIAIIPVKQVEHKKSKSQKKTQI